MSKKRPVHATLVGSDLASADGHIIRDASPVLALCRYLIRQGYDAERPLLAFRNHDLAMQIKSLAYGAEHFLDASSPRLSWSELKRLARQARAAQD